MRFDELAQAPALLVDEIRLPGGSAEEGSQSQRSDTLLLWPIWLHKIVVTGHQTPNDPFRFAVRQLQGIGLDGVEDVADALQLPTKLVKRLLSESVPAHVRGHSFVSEQRVMHIVRDALSGDLLPRFVGNPLQTWGLMAGKGAARRELPRAPHRPWKTPLHVVLGTLAEAPIPDPAEVRDAWLRYRRGLDNDRRRAFDPKAGTAPLAHPAELWLLPVTVVNDDATGDWNVWDPLTASTSRHWRSRVEDESGGSRLLRDAIARSQLRPEVELGLHELEMRGVKLPGESSPDLDGVRRVASRMVRIQLEDPSARAQDVSNEIGVLLARVLAGSLEGWSAADLVRQALRSTTPGALVSQRLAGRVPIPASVRHLSAEEALRSLSGRPRELGEALMATVLMASVQQDHPLHGLLEARPNALVTLDDFVRHHSAADPRSADPDNLWDVLAATAIFIIESEGI
jgi:hypothetical protein